MSLTYTQFVEKSIIYANNAEQFGSSNPTNNATEQSVMQIPTCYYHNYIENGFDPATSTPYEMFCQNEPLYLQTLSQINVDFDYGFKFDFSVIKQLPPNVKKCMVMLYCYINPSTLHLNDENYLPTSCHTHCFKPLQTFDEHIILIHALAQMNSKPVIVTHPQIIDAVGETMFNEVKQYLQPIVEKGYAIEQARKQTWKCNSENKPHATQSIDDIRNAIAIKQIEATKIHEQIKQVQNKYAQDTTNIMQTQLDRCKQLHPDELVRQVREHPELFTDYDNSITACKQQLAEQMREIAPNAVEFLKSATVMQQTIQPDIEHYVQMFGIDVTP